MIYPTPKRPQDAPRGRSEQKMEGSSHGQHRLQTRRLFDFCSFEPTFTFWWGRDSKAPNEYFDVFVSPEFDPKHTGMSPLIEEQRAIGHDTSEGAGRVILFLTLRNNNNFPIKFVANHVRIY
jgi:hypothetical protein